MSFDGVRRLRVLALGFSATVLATAKLASAGCENPCDVTVEPVTVEPPLPECVHVRSGNDGCQCGAFFAIWHNCSAPIVLTDASFCDPKVCSSLEPNATEQLVRWKESTVGSKTWTLHLTTGDGVTHTVTIKGEVKSFRGCSCSLMGASGVPQLGGLASLICAVHTLAARRRSKARRS